MGVEGKTEVETEVVVKTKTESETETGTESEEKVCEVTASESAGLGMAGIDEDREVEIEEEEVSSFDNFDVLDMTNSNILLTLSVPKASVLRNVVAEALKCMSSLRVVEVSNA